MSDSNMTNGHATRRARGFKGRVESPPPKLPVTTVRPHPMAWADALVLAEGDTSRCVPEPDGSVIIYNHPVR